MESSKSSIRAGHEPQISNGKRPKKTKIRRFKHSIESLVRENVSRDPDRMIRCAIAGPCSFALPNMMKFAFARHFLQQHPRETEQKGFLEKSARMVNERSSFECSYSNLVSDFVVKSERGYCCRIDVGSKCTFVQEDTISVSNFVRHFRDVHPALAKKHGFFKFINNEPFDKENNELKKQIQQLLTNPPPQPSPNEPVLDLYTRVKKHVAFHGGRFHCKITDQRCYYSQQIFKATFFRRHFCVIHPVQAMAHGFYEGFQKNSQPPADSVSSLLGKRKKMRELVEENVLIDASGAHCRISDTFCKYIQVSYLPENFMRHFRKMHPAEAIAKGMMVKRPRAKRIVRTESDDSSEFSDDDEEEEEEEEVESMPEEPTVEVAPQVGDAFDESMWLDAPSDDPAKYCRLCFSVPIGATSQQIFSTPEESIKSGWAALVEECTGVRLIAPEDYPAAVCHDCSSKLLDIKRFRMQCETLTRVVRRNRDKLRSNTTDEMKAEPSSPGPLVSIVEPAAQHLLIKEDEGDDDDEDKLSDSEEDEADSIEEIDENLPYIALQDDWFCCKQCNQIHQTLAAMVEHLNNHSAMGFFVKPKPAEAQVKQEERKENTSDANRAKYHAVTINGLNFYKCNDCDSLLSRECSVVRHWNAFHTGAKEVRLVCSMAGCSKNFISRRALKRHLRLEHSRHVTEAILEEHQVVTYGTKSYYKCNDCDTLMPHKQNMARHEKTHHSGVEEKARLYCEVPGCNQSFMTDRALNMHFKLHHNVIYDNTVECSD